jgi:hypothetical protein
VRIPQLWPHVVEVELLRQRLAVDARVLAAHVACGAGDYARHGWQHNVPEAVGCVDLKDALPLGERRAWDYARWGWERSWGRAGRRWGLHDLH